MGRMADARKKARRRGAGGGEKEPESKPVAKSPEAPAAPEPEPPAAEPSPATEAAPPSGELVFPGDPEPAAEPAPGRVALPASGLASEILAREELAGLGESEPGAAPAEPPPDAAAPTGDNLSFFSASAREEKTAVAEATEHLATFYLSNEEYGLPVRLVQEIIRVTEITQVPRAPDFIKGVINLRGRIIPVVDLRRKLKLGDVEIGRQSRIVVVKMDDRLIGLLVDGASQVLRVPVSSIEAAPEEVVEIEEQFIRGVAKLEKRLIILIDLSQVLARELRAVESQGIRA